MILEDAVAFSRQISAPGRNCDVATSPQLPGPRTPVYRLQTNNLTVLCAWWSSWKSWDFHCCLFFILNHSRKFGFLLLFVTKELPCLVFSFKLVIKNT